MEEAVVTYKISKKASGEWVDLPVEEGTEQKVSLLGAVFACPLSNQRSGEGYILTQSQKMFVVHDMTKTVVLDNKGKSAAFVLTSFPVILSLNPKGKGSELVLQNIKKKTSDSARLSPTTKVSIRIAPQLTATRTC